MNPGQAWRLVVFLLSSFAAWPLAASEPAAALPPVPAKIAAALQARHYAEAVAAVGEALEAKTEPADYLAYLKGWALCLDQQYDAAVAAFEQFEQQYPQSPWAARVRLAKAVALARKGDFRGAEALYRAEANLLLSDERKQGLADIYLSYADTYFRPAKAGEKPDYTLALEFYREALKLVPPSEKRAEVDLRVAECLERLQDLHGAAEAYAQFSETYPKSPLVLEARYRAGACRLALGEAQPARRIWQDLLASAADSTSERIAEAQFHLAETWGMPKPKTSDDLNLGIAALEAFLERFPDHKEAGKAFLSMAEGYAEQQRYDDVVRVLSRFLQTERYQQYPEIPEARWLLGRAYQLQKRYAEALVAWRDYLSKHPSAPRWNTIQQEVVNSEYLMGEERYEAHAYDEAKQLWSEFLTRYPLDERAPGILVHFGRMDQAQKRLDAALDEWRRVVSKYPDTSSAFEAQWLIAQTLEESLGQFDKALDEYRKIQNGSRAGDALQAIARLEGKSLAVATTRVFRSDETPKLRLTTRNLEAVTVRVYQVDLETYFRKVHLAQNVEQLNIALIDPDRSWEFSVPRYAKYQQLESELEIPLPEGHSTGVLAVTVSSKTLEATTLVLASDLDLIVKSSRSELFVLAENIRTGKPWPGVRLLISDGRQILAEATTDAQGVLQQDIEGLKEAADVRVFGVIDEQVASTAVGLQGVRIAERLTDKGYLFTDRPCYEAGQTVHVRGCLRQVEDDTYTVTPDRPYTLTILDPKNRELWHKDLTLGPFGSFQADVPLPAGAAPGDYRLLAQDAEERSYSGSFQVRALAEELVRLTVDTPRRVYCRGEELQGTIRATYAYGAPLVGRELSYQLAGDRVYRAKTDAQGEVAFTLPTREFQEIQTLPLVVTLAEEDRATTVNFLLAERAFAIKLSTPREVYLAEEPFEVTAKVHDPEGRPLAQSCTLKVLEQTHVEGKVAQRQVEEHALQTAEDGTARLTLKLAKGGTYILRAEAIDRFKNPVSRELALTISDPEDATRLRILTEEKPTWRVGDTAAVRVHWREQPALALVAFQSDRVLDYQLVDLQSGDNTLSLPITAAMAPNCELSVAVMIDVRTEPAEAARPVVRFHQASTPFTVERPLKVELSTKRTDGGDGPIRPGDEVAVTLRTTDPQGNPVPAELSLSLVPRSLVERFAWPMPAIDAFFRGTEQSPQVSTASSINFTCRPKTSPINPRLLAEKERQEQVEAEAASRQAFAQTAEGGSFGGGMGGGKAATPVAKTAPLALYPSPEAANAAGRPFESGERILNLDIEQLAKSQPAASPEDLGVETGYWNPSILTGEKGETTVTFRMPEQSTTWNLVAKGITEETLVGEASETLVVTKELFGQLRLPSAFTDGDQAEIGVTVHNERLEQGSIEVTLKTTIAQRTVEEHKTIEAKRGVHELSFKTALALAAGESIGQAHFELTVAAGEQRDVQRQSVPILPFGVPVWTAAGGSATSDTTVWVETPEGMQPESASLRIVAGPSVERSLLEIVAPTSSASPCGPEMFASGTGVEHATSDLLASLAIAKLLAGTPEVSGTSTQRLDTQIRTALGSLVASQSKEGGWSWSDRTGASHRYTTARAVWALSLARAAGYRVPDEVFHNAVTYLKNQLTAADAGDFESRAILLHALATAGEGDFALANHLYRDRPRLSNAALVYLALAFAEMDRKPMAAELLGLWAKRDPKTASSEEVAADLPWSQGAIELRALATLAAEQAGLPAPQIQEGVEWLLAHRTGPRWTPDKATGPAAMALAHWFAQDRFESERYQLAITVNDAPPQVLDIVPTAGSQVLAIPAAQLQPGKQQIRFRLTGRGRYTYQCLLGGLVPVEQLKTPTTEWRLERTYQPAPLELDGREVPRGFSVVQGTPTRFRNALAQLPVGRRGLVELHIQSTKPDGQARPWEYLVITEPIPAGTRVLESSLRGGFDHCEIGPGTLTFYVAGSRAFEPIRYEIYGALSGVYRAVPTLVRNAYRPEQMVVSTPAELTVLARGLEPSTPYRLTPDELFYLGTHLAEKGQKKEAAEHLSQLVDSWSLMPNTYQKTIQTLLELHLDLGPADKVVHDFEIVKEKWPEQEIPFHRIVQVGAAYEAMGEYERAYLVFRATLESSFLRDSGVAGFLDQKGEFLKSVDVLERLLREYPPEPYLAAAQFGLSQRVYAKAAEAANDPKLRELKLNRVDLTRRAWEMLERLLTEFPNDPAADQAAFSAANALVEMEDFAHAAEACRRYAERYPKSPLLDSFWYIIGYSQYAAGQTQEALEMCRKVSEAQALNPETGRPGESPNKWQAIYILGQIYHSLGQAADAVREYRRVEERFPDAKQAIAYFQRKTITLPEVSSFKPDEAVELDLKYRNLTQCDVKVYRVDLMKYGLLEGSLGGIAGINLAGIRPQLETAVSLGETADYRERTHRISLALKKEGAYLVVCRGENLHASGLVVVTPLTLEVQTDARANQVRVTLKDAVANACVNKAQIKVIGGLRHDFVSGTSDLRGVFVAEGIQGAPTVIAEVPPGRYAFYRSPGVLTLPSPVSVTAEASTPFVPRPVPTVTVNPAPQPPIVEADGHTWTFLSPAELHIREVLEQPTTVELTELPLTDVVSYLKDQHGIEIQLDQRALEEQGIALDTPITGNLQGMPLRSALKQLLRPHGLTYMLRDDALMITTPEQAAENLVTALYPVEDLLGVRTPSGEQVADYDSLISMITSTVDPSTWEEVGGTGTIAPFESRACLVISQTQEVHEEIAQLFRVLRKIPVPKEPFSVVTPSRRPDAGAMMGGGMGGGMSGMGGMRDTEPAASAAPVRRYVPLPSPAEGKAAANADLLGGLKQSNQRFQQQQVQQLQKMYQGGMGGGMKAGAANQPAGK